MKRTAHGATNQSSLLFFKLNFVNLKSPAITDKIIEIVILGRSQAVRQRTLNPPFVGSIPTAPATNTWFWKTVVPSNKTIVLAVQRFKNHGIFVPMVFKFALNAFRSKTKDFVGFFLVRYLRGATPQINLFVF